MPKRKIREMKEKAFTFFLLALVVLGIGYVGHMDQQDARAKAEGPQVYFNR